MIVFSITLIAQSLKCNKEELHEAFNIALIIGGSIVIPHLRYGFEVMEEIYAEKTDKVAEGEPRLKLD